MAGPPGDRRPGWSWSTTTSRFPGLPVAEVCAIARSAGLSGLEGGETSFQGWSEAALMAAAAEYRSAGLVIDTFHLPFTATDDIAAFYETARRETVRRMRFWMERASLLGAKIGILHPSTCRFSTVVEGLDGYLAALEKSFAELLPAAEALGLTLALENMLPGEQGDRFGSRPEHFALLREKFGHPRLAFCLDTGHALVAGRERAADFPRVMGRELVAFHLQDNAGDRDSHLAPGHGRVDWPAVFRGMEALGYRGVACIEASPFDFGPDYTPAAWRRMVGETAALARRALAG